MWAAMNEPDSRPQSPDAMLASATPWRRLMAITYESIILFGVLWFADYAFSALTQFRGETGALRTAFQLFTASVLGIYFVFFWSKGRHSLPMKTIAVRVITREGRPLSVGRALARYLAALAIPIIILAGAAHLSGWLILALPLQWVWCLLDRDHQSVYDRIAGTRLVHDPRPPGTRSVDV
jgi:uncharacterized RDD family membrane protein YckC